MSMATRCVACGTIFRVVQDQLKVSDGWVRCGRCDEVFNALEGLFDLERESPPPWQPGQARPAARGHSHQKAAADLEEEDRIASRFFRPEQEDVERTPAEAVAERFRTDFADARFEEDDEEAAIEEAPTFLREAQAEKHKRSPRVRLGFTLASALLSCVLLLQAVQHFRDGLAARLPVLRPLLATWCRFAGCIVDAPRRIDDITVEATALSQAAPGTNTYRLSVTLRNRGQLPVSLPSIELTLSDSTGQLVARRALGPAAFRATSTVVPAGTDVPLQVLFTTAGPRVAGYTVEVFYP